MTTIQLTGFESDYFDLLLQGSHPVLQNLREQINFAQIESRRISKAGYSLKFISSSNQISLRHLKEVKPSFHFGDVEVTVIDGKVIKNVGFILWINNGSIVELEGYTYGDDPWPEKIDEYQVSYISGVRNIDELIKIWCM